MKRPDGKVKRTVRAIVAGARGICGGEAKGMRFERELAVAGVLSVGIEKASAEAVAFMTRGWKKADYFVDNASLYYRCMDR